MKYKMKLDGVTVATAIAEYLWRRGQKVKVGTKSDVQIIGGALVWEVEVEDVEPRVNVMLTPGKGGGG